MAYRNAYNKNFGTLGVAVAQSWPERDIIKAKGKRKHTLGLALSGGGYRSAIYNYGVLSGLYEIGVIPRIDYLSVVSGGSWMGTAFSMTKSMEWFFRRTWTSNRPNFIEEGFESLLPHPGRVLQEAALARKNVNYASNIYGRLLAKTFLREHGDLSRYKPLSDGALVRDKDRPFLIINGTVYFRRPKRFEVTQECFEMTRLYCGSRSLGYLDTPSLRAPDYPIRIRDAIAVSGAAVSLHIPGLGSEVLGLGLSREVKNYTLRLRVPRPGMPDAAHLDLADGGFYNNLGVESLIHRGCRYIIVVDAEHDPEKPKTKTRSNQGYSGLRTLLKRHHIPMSLKQGMIATLDRADEAVHIIPNRDPKLPDVLYIKLKSSKHFDRVASKEDYNQPGFLQNLFRRGKFSFNPQFSTAKLDYDFAEHRNLSELGRFEVLKHKALIKRFAARST
ncbi:MAG: patatin-like phospholipase family protein [Planctomycetes bacterium]|nr:patatin-like phospholipase family protein [Planctomycetota bacterium]